MSLSSHVVKDLKMEIKIMKNTTFYINLSCYDLLLVERLHSVGGPFVLLHSYMRMSLGIRSHISGSHLINAQS